MAEGDVTLEQVRAERERRRRATMLQAAAGGQPVSVEAIRAERARRAAKGGPKQPLPAFDLGDVGEQLVQGVERAPSIFAGLPGDLSTLIETGGYHGIARLAHPNETREQIDSRVADQLAFRRARTAQAMAPGLPGFEDINPLVDEYVTPIGRQSDPRSLAGQYARTIGEFAPNAVIPGSGAARAARVVMPAATSEASGQAARRYAPDYEPLARIVGGVVGGLATEASIAARGVPRGSARPAIDPEVAASEAEFGPLTQGERLRDPAMMQREMNLRRSGPTEAQTALRGFDDQRAPVLADNLMRRVATRGQDPVNPDVGSAGTMLADELRTQYENMQLEQASRYDRAFELAQNERVAANEVADELLAGVDRVISENFLDVPNARSVIMRLQNQIASGEATYGTVERARQQLNRLLGASMRSGDDAATFGIRRVIDEVDRFVEPKLSGEARQALSEARGFTREMLNQFDEQARPGLATGHTGRRDPGGRVIRNIIETDMTGEQVIDQIFGASVRPSRGALSAVQRIKDRSTQTTNTRGYTAPTAPEGQNVRVPGRRSLRGGRVTRGGRAFDPTPAQAARFGVEPLPNELQALREAFVYRIRRPLDARRTGDIIEAGTMARNLRQALHGPGKEVTRIIFNESEIAAMERALKHLERITPPTGSWEPSAPGVARDAAERTFMALVGRLIGKAGLAGAGQAIQDGVVNARALRDARAAIAPPPRASSYRPPPAPTKPRFGAVSAQSGAIAVPGAIRTQERRMLEPGAIR